MGRKLARSLAVITAWLAGAAVVRLGLAWADTYPYSQSSEIRYGLVATAALSIAIGGTAVALLWGRNDS